MAEYDISCRRLTDLTTDYLEEAMDSALRTTFEQHLVFCDYCVAHLGQLRVTHEVLSSLGEPTPGATERVLAAVRQLDA